MLDSLAADAPTPSKDDARSTRRPCADSADGDLAVCAQGPSCDLCTGHRTSQACPVSHGRAHPDGPFRWFQLRVFIVTVISLIRIHVISHYHLHSHSHSHLYHIILILNINIITLSHYHAVSVQHTSAFRIACNVYF